VRWLIYFLDAMSLCLTVVKTQEAGDADVVIFDRYLYDELANLPLDHPITRAYVRLLLNFAPQPDIAYWLDAEPSEARERKPEYPLEFLHRSRAAYTDLSEIAGVTVIAPGSLQTVATRIMRSFLKKFPVARLSDFASVAEDQNPPRQLFRDNETRAHPC
jgi:thymidylate kinase